LVNRIYLVGFMGVGKTTVGKKLARQLGYRFVDLDDFFEERYKIEIHQFFKKYDEPLFRQLEHERLIKTFEMQNVVVATGGGTPCHWDGVQEINRNGLSVFLDMPPEAIANRLMHAKRKRPLILGKSSEELIRFIKSKLDERMACYAQSHLRVDALNTDLKELANLIETYPLSHDD
jgi:shikimate kinase